MGISALGPTLAAKVIAEPAKPAWPAWDGFAETFMQDDGRVIERTAQARTVSEAQAYGMFFALVANDRARFERMLAWTANNLAQGDLRHHLPSWLWGLDDKDKQWHVLDPNSAADADLWLAYDLLEAGRLWKRADYAEIGRAVLDQVAANEVMSFGANIVLLPGPLGFDAPDGPRLNPSYLPAFQMDYFAGVDKAGPWSDIRGSFLKLLPAIVSEGCVPDWFLLAADGPHPDAAGDGRGSYDAIRVYLWAGLGSPAMPDEQPLLQILKPYIDVLRKAGRLPERCYPGGRAPEGSASAGMEAALLPFYQKLGADDLLRAAQQRIAADAASSAPGKPENYYERALNLFGQGWIEQRYRFDSAGKLIPQWHGRP